MSSRRYREALKSIEDTAHSLKEAVSLLKGLPPVKFNETIEVSCCLSLDPKKSDQQVRGTVDLPHGTGKARKVAVFCKGEKEIEAKEAGADFVGAKELIEKVQNGWMDFDVAISTPDMMRDVSRLGKVLGPRGMMPNPKIGTVTDNVAQAITDVKKGKVQFKMDKLANMHIVIGRRSFEEEQLVENAQAAVDAMLSAKPGSCKGKMIRSLSLSGTMSPGIRLSIEGLE